MMNQFQVITCRNGAAYLVEQDMSAYTAWGFNRVRRVLVDVK